MGFYTDIQYGEELPKNAIADFRKLIIERNFTNAHKILDIGCSKGRIMELFPKDSIIGIDYDEKALKIAKDKGFNVKKVDVAKGFPFKEGEFDGVLCSQVIEHMENPLHLMQEIHRVLKTGGRAVIITPDYLMTHDKEDGFWADYTHKTPFISSSLRRISYESGFRKIKVYHFIGKYFRNFMRSSILSPDFLIKIQKLPFVWKGRDLVLEVMKE